MFCNACGQQIPEGSAFCGKCGGRVGSVALDLGQQPPRSKVPTMVVFGAGVGLLFLIYLATVQRPDKVRPNSELAEQTTHKDQPGRAKVAHEELPRISAAQIVREYEANEVAADHIYKGRQLFIVGRVGEVKKDILDNPYVILDAAEFDFRGVQAFFDNDALSQLLALQKGQVIGVIGKCDGLMMNVLIRECRLVGLGAVPTGSVVPVEPPIEQSNAAQGGSPLQSTQEPNPSAFSESTALAGPAEPHKSTGATVEVPVGILEVLKQWRESMLSGNVDAQIDCYAPTVEVFFRRKNLDRASVGDIKRSGMAAYPNVKTYRLSDLALASRSDERAAVTFRKYWDALDPSRLKHFSGEEIQRLTFVKLEGDWKIVREEELQVYWVRKE